mmetsp:Transcript_10243/g.22738  ORF Transcript_10243/g.22738 Transcript_10243/m.22738 type:complete len:124 (-) Transcript_10243:1765-2136(-)
MISFDLSILMQQNYNVLGYIEGYYYIQTWNEVLSENECFFLSKDDTWADDAWIFSHCFCMACDWFGKGKVTELVDEIILKSIWRRPIVIQNLVLVAATNPDILVDSLYFLFCRNLTASIPFYS